MSHPTTTSDVLWNLLGSFLGLLGYYLGEATSHLPIIDLNIKFLNIEITTTDFHNAFMAVICTTLGWLVTRLLNYIRKKIKDFRSK